MTTASRGFTKSRNDLVSINVPKVVESLTNRLNAALEFINDENVKSSLQKEFCYLIRDFQEGPTYKQSENWNRCERFIDRVYSTPVDC